MLVASGPGSLGVALAAELDGQVAVLPSAVAFTVGCLLAPAATQRIVQLGLSARVAWPLLGTGMLIGWLAAPWQLSGLLLAQFCSGLSLTAFQGDMDTRIAERANPERVTSALASAAAIRAIGTAIAVRCIPTLVAAPAINAFSAAALIALIAGTVILRVIKPATPAHAPAEPRAALETLGVAPPLRT